MLTVGSISRDVVTKSFPFLAPFFRGRREAIKQFTHRNPDFVFWIYPDGRVHDARDSHVRFLPKGFEHIVDDEPDYGGFLRGRVVSANGEQVIVVYCQEDALATNGVKMRQFIFGIDELPIPVKEDAIVISDNADLYGTLADVRLRIAGD
jgi:hypothetical protein